MLVPIVLLLLLDTLVFIGIRRYRLVFVEPAVECSMTNSTLPVLSLFAKYIFWAT